MNPTLVSYHTPADARRARHKRQAQNLGIRFVILSWVLLSGVSSLHFFTWLSL